MKTRKIPRVIAAVAFSALVSVFPLASAQTALGDHDLVVGTGFRDWSTFDPHITISQAENTILEQIYEGLVGHPPGDYSSFTAGLAESWERSEDGLTWTFHLKQGVQWHKGYGEFTADDVVFSLGRVDSEELGSPFRGQIPIVTIEAVDRYTVRLTLSDPDPILLLKLTNYRGGNIMSKAAVAELGEGIAANPIGTGPFVFDSHVPREHVTIRRNDEYHGDLAPLTSVQFLTIEDRNALDAAAQTGAVDVARGAFDIAWVNRWTNTPLEVNVIRGPGSAAVLHFDTTRPPFNDIRVRQAVAHAINRQELVDSIFGTIGQVIHSPVPMTYWGGTDEVKKYEFNPDLARQLLSEAGYPNGLTLSLVHSEQQQEITPMLIIQEYLRQVGINIELEIVDHATMHRLVREGRNEMVFYAAARLPDASQYFAEFYDSSRVTTFSRISVLDEAIREAIATVDDEARRNQYEDIQRSIMDELYALPLYLQPAGVVVRQPYVQLNYEPAASLTGLFDWSQLQLNR